MIEDDLGAVELCELKNNWQLLEKSHERITGKESK